MTYDLKGAGHMAFELSMRMSSNPACEVGALPRGTPAVVFTPVMVHNITRNFSAMTTPCASAMVPTDATAPTRGVPQVIARTVLTSTPSEQTVHTPQFGRAHQSVLSKSNKKDTKKFVLRNIDKDNVCGRTKERAVGWKLMSSLRNCMYISVMQGTAVVNIRSKEDLQDVWMDARKCGPVV